MSVFLLPADPQNTRGPARFSVRYWGVRGSTQVPGPSTLRFGGNTTCIAVRCDDELLVIDAGTGLRGLGASLREDEPFRATLLFTHFHLDHVAGLPFFAPLFRRDCALDLVSDPEVGGGARVALPRLMSAPLFPVDFGALPSALAFVDADPTHPVEVGGARVRFAALHHPGGASGLRIEHRGRSFVHLSDLEHLGPAPEAALTDFASDCDALSYDAMFDEAIDYAPHEGWGHSTWQAGLALARAAGARRYIATHHAPEHDDAFLDGVTERLKSEDPSALVAWEGLELDLLTGEVRSHTPAPNQAAELVCTGPRDAG